MSCDGKIVPYIGLGIDLSSQGPRFTVGVGKADGCMASGEGPGAAWFAEVGFATPIWWQDSWAISIGGRAIGSLPNIPIETEMSIGPSRLALDLRAGVGLGWRPDNGRIDWTPMGFVEGGALLDSVGLSIGRICGKSGYFSDSGKHCGLSGALRLVQLDLPVSSRKK